MAAAATTSVFACQQLVGIPGDPPVPTAVRACGLPYGTNACASCAATNCCTESSACAADSACAPYEACYGDCKGDWQCRSQCLLDNPVGRSDQVAQLSACLASQCETECALTCGALAGDFSVPAAASECQKCGAANGACSVERACAASVDCTALALCLHTCETFDCSEACDNAHPTAETLYNPYHGAAGGSVFDGTCAVPCAFGQNWTCVGQVHWPYPQSDTTTLTVDVTEYGGGMLPGVDVSVCNSLGDPDCPKPLVDGGTNDAGRVVLPVSNVSANFVGLDGYLELTSPSTEPTLWYWGFPLSEASLSLINWDFAKIPVELTSPSTLAALVMSAGPTLELGLGVVVAIVIDCHGSPASGVKVSASGLRAYYGVGDPNLPATDSTDHFVTFANVQPGSLDLSAVPVMLGKESSHRTVRVRANTLTFTYLFPTP